MYERRCIIVDADLDHLAEVVFLGLLHGEVTPFSPTFPCGTLKGSHPACSTLKKGELCSASLRSECVHKNYMEFGCMEGVASSLLYVHLAIRLFSVGSGIFQFGL